MKLQGWETDSLSEALKLLVASEAGRTEFSLATVRALGCAPGPYNIVDDNPSEQRVWLTAFARYCGALEPPHVSEQQALQAAGPDAVYYATRLRGGSNAKAKRELVFRPRPLQWLANTAGKAHG